MIGLLDPALFLPRADNEVKKDLECLIKICQKHSIQFVLEDASWTHLWKNLARDLEKNLTPQTKRVLHELRKLGGKSNLTLPTLNISDGKIWRKGFTTLFAQVGDGKWEQRMANAAVKAIMSGRKVIVLTRLMRGRNVQLRSSGHCTLLEVTRWNLHVQTVGIGHRQILCVYHPRNLSEDWTTRYDWCLPSASDRGTHPFCPPDQWWKGSVSAWRSVASKPAWIDKFGNGWVCPNIPGKSYHWDVFITHKKQLQLAGLSPINVTKFGVPAREGRAGTIHHTPTNKLSRQTGKGWQCR